MKFKVGDWVRIVKPLWADENFNDEMKNRIVKIERIRDCDIICPYIFIYKDKARGIADDEIELYKPVLKKFIEEMENKECK